MTVRTPIFVAALLFSPAALAQHGGEHHCPGPSPVMQTGDFDGNGVIGAGDVAMISAYVEAGDYAAYFDMNVDGVLDGKDVSAVATHIGEAGSARDAEMAALWATIEPYRDVTAAYAAGYIPFTPDLRGHGIHFANFGLINSWGERGFQPGAPEGLNYTPEGELVAAFYYAPAAIDLADYGYDVPQDTFYQTLPVPASFTGVMPHAWHHHIGTCFGSADTCPVAGFDQCMDEATCEDLDGQLWSPMFHMIHVWMFELNECGPFGGIDEDISVDAPEEPNHGDCNVADVVPVAFAPEGDVIAPMGFTADACYDE